MDEESSSAEEKQRLKFAAPNPPFVPPPALILPRRCLRPKAALSRYVRVKRAHTQFPRTRGATFHRPRRGRSLLPLARKARVIALATVRALAGGPRWRVFSRHSERHQGRRRAGLF